MLHKQMVLGLALALIASPVVAADKAQSDKAAAKPTEAKEKTYCLAEAPTGTRMTSKVCKTKAEWQKEGIDIEAEARG